MPKHSDAAWTPEKGERVAVCYDGKMGRAVEGEVLAVRGCFVQVRFDQWAGDAKGLVQWFPRTGESSFGAHVPLEDALMPRLAVAFGWRAQPSGDWYSVRPRQIILDAFEGRWPGDA